MRISFSCRLKQQGKDTEKEVGRGGVQAEAGEAVATTGQQQETQRHQKLSDPRGENVT